MKLLTKIKTFFTESRRVLKITRKPNATELKTILKVTALGMLIIGALGFVVHLVKILITHAF